jgi:hypothetical protein
MTGDLRKTNIAQVTITQDYPVSGSDRITLRLPVDSDKDGVPDLGLGGITWSADPVTFKVEPVDGKLRLIRDESSDIIVLAENVKSVSFMDYTIDTDLYMDEIKIILELEETDATGKTTNMVFTSTVNLRN